MHAVNLNKVPSSGTRTRHTCLEQAVGIWPTSRVFDTRGNERAPIFTNTQETYQASTRQSDKVVSAHFEMQIAQ